MQDPNRLPIDGPGGYFLYENYILDEIVDTCGKSAPYADALVKNKVHQLEVESPFVNQPVTMELKESVPLVREGEETLTFSPRILRGEITGMWGEVEDLGGGNLMPIFGVWVRPNHPTIRHLKAKVLSDVIGNVELLNTSNPLAFQRQFFKDLMDQYIKQKRNTLDYDPKVYSQHVVDSIIAPNCPLFRSEIELNVMTPTAIAYCTEEALENALETDDDDPVECLKDDYSGKIFGQLVDFEPYEDSQGNYLLEATVLLPSDHPLAIEYHACIVKLVIDDVQNGRILKSPVLNMTGVLRFAKLQPFTYDDLDASSYGDSYQSTN